MQLYLRKTTFDKCLEVRAADPVNPSLVDDDPDLDTGEPVCPYFPRPPLHKVFEDSATFDADLPKSKRHVRSRGSVYMGAGAEGWGRGRGNPGGGGGGGGGRHSPGETPIVVAYASRLHMGENRGKYRHAYLHLANIIAVDALLGYNKDGEERKVAKRWVKDRKTANEPRVSICHR